LSSAGGYARRIGIRAAILGSFGAVAVLLIGFLVLSVWNRGIQGENLAATEAEQVAAVIAATIARGDPEAGQPVLYDNPAALQRYIHFLHSAQQRDIEVVGPTGRILADAVPEDIGQTLEGDLAVAAALVHRTGRPQRFVEISKSYPHGIRQVAVPTLRDGQFAGVVILEYTPLYDQVVAQAARMNRIEGGLVALILVLTIMLGFYTARLVSRESAARSESAQLRGVAHLANAAAHEINNPLTTVIGRLDMLAERLPTESRERELVTIARGESARITQMVEHMQNITHLEYLSTVGPDLPATLDLKKSADPPTTP
jgi:signal transduction histidine kinase